MLWQLFALNPDRMTSLERTLLRVALFIGLFAIVWTYRDIRTYFGADLRNRVVGARVMLAGNDPYTFVWQPGMPEELLDPVYDPKAHRLTISPPTLLLYAAIAPLPYKSQRSVSFAAEWLALIVSLALLARSLPDMRQRVVLLLGATLFVIATDVWRLHVERGQLYVFHLLALSAAIAWSQCGKVDSIPAGIAFGVLALMRPNLLVLAPAMLLMRQWRAPSAMLATIGVGVAATFLMLPTSSWQSYLDVGDQYYLSIQDPESMPDRFRPTHGKFIEGVEFGNSLPNVESSSFAVLYQTLHERFGLPMLNLALTSKIILLAIACLLLVLVWQRRGDLRSALALSVVLALDTEFFLPHRWGYADVMLLAPLALMLPALLREERTNRQVLAVVLIGLVSGPLGKQFFDLYAATVLRSWLVMGGLSLLACHDVDWQRCCNACTKS
jgi:hypothetical protein